MVKDREQLLTTAHEWKRLQKEIAAQDTEFDVLPLTRDYLRILQRLCLECITLQNERLFQCHHYFDTLWRVFKMPSSAEPYLFVGEIKRGAAPSFDTEQIPVEQFENLLREYDRLQQLAGT